VFELVGWFLDVVFVCVGGGSNVIGIFLVFIDDVGVCLCL